MNNIGLQKQEKKKKKKKNTVNTNCHNIIGTVLTRSSIPSIRLALDTADGCRQTLSTKFSDELKN